MSRCRTWRWDIVRYYRMWCYMYLHGLWYWDTNVVEEPMASLFGSPRMKGQYRYKEARIRTIALSEPIGGGGPAKGVQLKNLKSHKASLNGEATLYNSNTLESLTALFFPYDRSWSFLASTYHHRRPKTLDSLLWEPHNIRICQKGKGYGRIKDSSKVIDTCEREIINKMQRQQSVKSMCFWSKITVILKIQQWEQVQVIYVATDMVKHLLRELLICSIRSENTLKGMFVNPKEWFHWLLKNFSSNDSAQCLCLPHLVSTHRTLITRRQWGKLSQHLTLLCVALGKYT